MPKFDVVVQLSGRNGNAFVILGLVRRALVKAGASGEQIQEFTDEATSADYEHLLATCMNWVDAR